MEFRRYNKGERGSAGNENKKAEAIEALMRLNGPDGMFSKAGGYHFRRRPLIPTVRRMKVAALPPQPADTTGTPFMDEKVLLAKAWDAPAGEPGRTPVYLANTDVAHFVNDEIFVARVAASAYTGHNYLGNPVEYAEVLPDDLLRPVIVRVRNDGGTNPVNFAGTCNFTYKIFHFAGVHTSPLATALLPLKPRMPGASYQTAANDTFGAAVYLPGMPGGGDLGWRLIEAFGEYVFTGAIDAIVENQVGSGNKLESFYQQILGLGILPADTIPTTWHTGVECPAAAEPSFDGGEWT